MKQTLLVLSLLVTTFLFSSCGGDVDTSREGLDLQAVLALARTARSPQDFENKLNAENGINNLDLNEDGNVDYISVDEYEAQGSRNMSLFVDYGSNGRQQVAELFCNKINDAKVNCQVVGNDKVYGRNPVYETSYDRSDDNDFLMWYLIFNSGGRPYYHSTYYNYNRPIQYRVRDYDTYYRTINVPTYRDTRVTRSSSSSSTSSKLIYSPSAGKSSPSVTRSSTVYSSSRPSSSSSSSRPSSSSSSSSRSSSSSSRSSSSSSSRSSSSRR